MLTIITRTSSRKELFLRLVKSINNQPMRRDIQQIVLADNEDAYNYASDICFWLAKYSYRVAMVKSKSDSPGFYNLYINDGLEMVKDGWILIVDDDDYLEGENLSSLLYLINDEREAKFYIVQFYRGHKVKPPVNLFANWRYKAGDSSPIVRGKIGSSCILFRKDQCEGILWDDKLAADYRFIKAMAEQNDYVFIPSALVRATISGNKGRDLYR